MPLNPRASARSRMSSGVSRASCAREEELPDLVGEPAQGQQVTVRRPLRRVLLLEQLLDERELVGRREHIGRLRVAERGEPLAEDQMPEPVERHDVEAGQRRGQPRDQRVARRSAARGAIPRSARPAPGRRRPPRAARTVRGAPRTCRFRRRR